jgi:hypothetical protein
MIDTLRILIAQCSGDNRSSCPIIEGLGAEDEHARHP